MNKERRLAIVSTLIGIALALFMTEIAARFLAPPWLEARMNYLNPVGDRAFGTDRDWKVVWRDGKFLRFQSNTQADISNVEYHNTANIDDLGTRRIYPSGVVASGPPVPLLGDSFTFGIGVEDDETFASLVAKEFPAIKIINAGVPGSALDAQLQLIRWRHDEFGKPKKYVFFFFLGNDFSDMLDAARRRARTASAAPSDAVASPIDRLQAFLAFANDNIGHNRILRHSYLIQWTRSFVLQVYNGMRRRAGVQADVEPVFLIMDRNDARYYGNAQAALEEQVAALNALQVEFGFTSLLIAIPDKYQLDADARKNRMTMYGYDQANLDPLRPNQLLESTARKAGVRLFDSTPCLRSFAHAADLYFKLDNHFTKLGHRQFAQCIKPELDAFLGQ